MTTRHFVLALALAMPAAALIELPRAAAQSSTTGAIQGQVTDEATGEKLAGVTVVVTSTAIHASQTEITDENGFYKVGELPPGDYKVTFYFNQLTVEHSGINVGINKVTPVFQALKLSLVKGEIVEVKGAPPTIDPTSTTQGITLDKNYLRNIPVPGRTFDTALGAAAGSQNDGVGVSFSGSSSLENQYIVDGVNTTGLTFGTVGSPVINDFIEEIEIITGGYNAEYGRATGGVVNVVTKSGSNELKGSIFGTIQPGFLTAPAQGSPINASSIDATANNAYQADFGFELGGPIIKDKAWFFIGFAPQLSRTDITRTTKSETDCRITLPNGQLSACDPRFHNNSGTGGFADGQPDVDPKTGFFITDNLDSQIRSDTARAYNILSKINVAIDPDNQLQVAFQGMPRTATTPGIIGLATSGTQGSELTTDVSAKWTSKFNDNKTEIEAVAGWHRDHTSINSIDPAFENQPLQALTDGSLGTWGTGFHGESARTIAGCSDGGPGTADPYPFLSTNCPMNSESYVVGGPGALTNDTEQRLAGSISLTERVKALGSHEIKAGLDIEDNTSDKARLYSGGQFIQNFVAQSDIRINRFVQLAPPDSTDPRYDEECNSPVSKAGSIRPMSNGVPCAFIGGTLGGPGTQVNGSTLNWAAFLRDSWQVLPNLTLNLGIRYEEQKLRYASFLQHTQDPLTQQQLGKDAMSLDNMWAPRLGAIYDWTHEGRSKIYAHWGRFFESIPMDINERSFGGEVQYIQDYSTKPQPPMPPACGNPDSAIGGANGINCTGASASQQLIGANGVLVAPGIKPQYLDEFVAGAEYELIDDLKIGLSYQNRRLGRVIEDVSTDGANTYIIANPGEWSSADENALKAQINSTMDPTVKARLANQLALFQGIRIFDKPQRNYNALQLTVTRRFSKALYLQGSYTYSRTTGNYPGLISYDNGQIDPNISSQYDLIELLANRQGPLPQDRPHYFKLDGYYTFDLHRQGALTVGARIRALSGIPENALGSHYLYGANESFLLPRGELGRTDFTHGVDLHVEYARRISPTMEASVFVDVFNIYNSQGTAAIDQTYAPPVSLGGRVQNANPISGGDYSDLIWLKTVNAAGNESPTPIGRNPNFGNTIGRYAPANGRIGARLTF